VKFLGERLGRVRLLNFAKREGAMVSRRARERCSQQNRSQLTSDERAVKKGERQK